MLPNLIEMLSKLPKEEQEQAYVILAAQYGHCTAARPEATPVRTAALHVPVTSLDDIRKELSEFRNDVDSQYKALHKEVRSVKSEYSGLEAGLAALRKVGGPGGRGVLSVLNYADKSTIADTFVLGTYRDMLP